MKTVLNVNNIDPTNEPLFLGEDLGIQRYDICKYPKFMELYEKQFSNIWRPEEVSLSKDRSDYLNLTDTERFVFENNLRWQTMTDSMLSRSISQIAEYCTNPELEINLVIWAFFETIHSNSYTYILKNIRKDPKNFFESILKDPEIVKRAKETADSYDRIIGDPSDLRQKIFDCVISTQIAEGLAFYISFICSFYFGHKGKMEGNAKIVSLIARDENLHVAITQNILKIWKDNPKEGFSDIVNKNEDKVYEMFRQAVNTEKQWAEYLFSKGSLVGLNEVVLGKYIEWLANNRLRSLGYKEIFETSQNPLGNWVDPYFDSKKKKNMPQETEIESYSIGSRDTNIDLEDMGDFSLD